MSDNNNDNASVRAMAQFGVKLGGGPAHLHQPVPAVATEQQQLDADKLFARQIRPQISYVAAAAQPTYGFMATQPVQSGRVQEVLFISIWGVDPFSTSVTGQTVIAQSNDSGGNAAVLATLAAGGAGVNTYMTGFQVTGLGATAATAVEATINNTIGGTLRYQIGVPAGATTPITPLVVNFSPALPAISPNTAMTLTVPAFGAGNTQSTAVIQGYQQATPTSLAGQAIGFISTFVPQDSSIEPAFPNLVLAPQNLPVINAPSRRQVLMFPNERFVICMKGLANNAQLQAAIGVVEYNLGEFLKALAP